MTEMNEEWAQSIIKLGLIEEKKRLQCIVGNAAFVTVHSEGEPWKEQELSGMVDLINRYAEIDALLRDDKATAKLAAEVVKASRK